MSRFKCTDLLLINSSKLRHILWHSALYGKFHYMTAFRDSARIFRIADIMGYIEVFCNFSVVDCDLLQRLLLLYLWETTDAWSLRQLQLACAFGVRLPSVFRVDWSDSWLYISDERWAEIALRDWEIASLSQCWAQTGCIEPNSAFKHYIVSPVLCIHQ